MIQTVKGAIPASELGVTMCHEHLALDLSPVRGDQDSNFDDSRLVCKEIEKMKALGVQSVIEVTCNDMGRDVRKLREYSETCGIHIVASTGYYLKEYHSEFVKMQLRRSCVRYFAGKSQRELMERILKQELSVRLPQGSLLWGKVRKRF